MHSAKSLLTVALAPCGLAYVAVNDPSDYVNLAADTSDNAILADFNITPELYQVNAIVGPYYYNGTSKVVSHAELSVDANDTSVIVVTEG